MTARSLTTSRLRLRPVNASSELTASIDLPTNENDSRVNSGRRIRPGSLTIYNKHCSVELTDICKDDLELEKNGTPTRSSDRLNPSMLVGESVTSLAPSVAATYVLDADETLGAQGLGPAVVVHSREDLLLSPTRELRVNGNRLISRGSRLAEVSKESSLTPRATPTMNRDGLWDVIETEEYTEDGEGQIHSQKGGTLSRTEYQNLEDGTETPEGLEVDTVEEVDCYRSLPNPSASQENPGLYQVGIDLRCLVLSI